MTGGKKQRLDALEKRVTELEQALMQLLSLARRTESDVKEILAVLYDLRERQTAHYAAPPPKRRSAAP